MSSKYLRPFFLGSVLVSGFVVAQSPAPQTYSLTALSRMTEASMFSGRESNVTIYRNGSKELVEVVLAPQGGDSTGVHTRSLFDLQARKVYMQDMVKNTCSWMRYISAEMPSYDPIAASAAATADFAKQNPTVVGRESINGIPAKIVEIAGPPEQGKSRVWIAENGNFFVKLEMTGPDGKAMTVLEVKQVSFSKPSDSFFIPPSSCGTQAQGEMSSTGFSAHSESSVEASASGSADLKTNQARGEARLGTSSPTYPQSGTRPAPAGVAAMGATAAQATARVTAVRLHLVPDSYTGPCPGQVQLVGEITTNGPGTVWYQFLAGAVSNSPEGTAIFRAAGTQTVTVEGTFRTTPRVPTTSLIAIMEDQNGNHGPRNLSSGPIAYNITCTGQPNAPGAAVSHAQTQVTRDLAKQEPTSASGLPEGTTVEAKYVDGTPISFKPQEQVAFLFVQTIKSLESDPCMSVLKRLCSMNELVQGVKNKTGRVVGFKRNPMQEADYEYRLTFFGQPHETASRYQLEVISKRPGTGGFLFISDRIGFRDLYFNPNGPATTNDKKLGSYGSIGDDFRAR